MSASIPDEIFRDVEELTRSRITGFSFAGGGCINKGGRLVTDKREYFLKWNDADRYPGMFKAEAKGLALLREADCFRVPMVIGLGHAGAFQFLLLEYIDEGRSGVDYRDFGVRLAALHKQSGDSFGLDHDNYIGSLPQHNDRRASWTEFFIARRLTPQLDIARDGKRIDSDLYGKFESLFKKLPSILPDERPSLLHGDLWSGNLMTDLSGQPCLIDPAVYYGNREVDLAMTLLFGGFRIEFIDSYNSAFPLLPGYPARFDIYNLYPLLVHLNLFGSSYRAKVVSILDQFV